MIQSIHPSLNSSTKEGEDILTQMITNYAMSSWASRGDLDHYITPAYTNATNYIGSLSPLELGMVNGAARLVGGMDGSERLAPIFYLVATGGLTGALGGVAGSYMGGTRGTKSLVVSGVIGGAFGMITGNIGGTYNLAKAVKTSMVVGGVFGGLNNGLTTHLTNPNATLTEITNDALKGSVSGMVSGAVTGPFNVAGSSLSAQFVGAQLGFGTDLSMSGINTLYDFIQAPTNRLLPNNTLRPNTPNSIQQLIPSLTPHIPQYTPINLPRSSLN